MWYAKIVDKDVVASYRVRSGHKGTTLLMPGCFLAPVGGDGF